MPNTFTENHVEILKKHMSSYLEARTEGDKTGVIQVIKMNLRESKGLPKNLSKAGDCH
jgi:hypothetical protein